MVHNNNINKHRLKKNKNKRSDVIVFLILTRSRIDMSIKIMYDCVDILIDWGILLLVLFYLLVIIWLITFNHTHFKKILIKNITWEVET